MTSLPRHPLRVFPDCSNTAPADGSADRQNHRFRPHRPGTLPGGGACRPQNGGDSFGVSSGNGPCPVFFGVEKSEAFAAASAPFALVGLVASQTFVFCYYKGSGGSAPGVLSSVLKASLAAVCGYLAVASLLTCLHFTLAFSILVPVVSIFFFSYLFRNIANHTMGARAALTLKTILIRAGSSAAIIIAITALPRLAGPAWSGLFSSFPSTLFPLILIVHLTYGKAHAHTIIKNFPMGLGSLIIYCISVSAFYPRLGIFAGTAASFFTATLYLVVYSLAYRRIRLRTLP